MRLICAIPFWRLSVGLVLLGVVALLGHTLGGDEWPGQGKVIRQPSPVAAAAAPQSVPRQPEPIRVSRRSEQNDLDPSIEETPALPVDSPAAEPADEASAFDSQPQIKRPPAGRDAPDAHPAHGPTAWPRPTSLLDQLAILAETDSECAAWALRVNSELDQLVALPSLDDVSAAAILHRLSKLAEESRQIARRLPSEADTAHPYGLAPPGAGSRSQILRAGFAIVRRLAVWEPARRAAQSASAARPASPPAAAESRQRLRLLVAAVEAELPRTGDARPWRDYLLLEHLQREVAHHGGTSDSLRSVSREVLYRLHSTQLSEVQTQFLARPAFRNLREELRACATETADLSDVLAAIEAYEQQSQAAAAVRLADLFDQLRWSINPHVAELAAAINTYYRNANVRVAISAELVNRLLPGEQVVSGPVVDTIQNAYVEGHSQTNTKIRLVLLPTRGRWEFGIEAVGDVASATTSSSGPARFHQHGWSNFRARKRLTVDRRGIRLFQAEAEANADTQLNDFETEFDGIPLLQGLARAIARNQYEQKSPAARYEVEGKISYRASAELDKQVAARIEKTRREIQRQMVQPLQDLQLEPTALDMETTQERLIARYRLAGRDQVSAYTPRPQAPGDSLLSVQIHESALNNVLEHLHLRGRRVDLVTLYKEMADRFSEKKVPVPEDIPSDVFVTFADEDPVRIDCADGHVRLTIQLKALEDGGEVRFRDLTVIARYKPDPDQLDANLVRDGIFELPKTSSTRDRLALSAIFGKVLNRNRKLSLINERISKSPQLSDQQVTQFVIHDGWIGVALGPKTPERQAQATQRVQR